MTNKTDSCGELSTAVITGEGSCICGLGCRDGRTCRTFPSAALLNCINKHNISSTERHVFLLNNLIYFSSTVDKWPSGPSIVGKDLIDLIQYHLNEFGRY